MDPKLPTMPQTFRNAGYQAYAVGKLHVYPQRNRIGFDEVILCEEGRHQFGGVVDDFERFLEREGYAGYEFTHAMGSNEYCTRPVALAGTLPPNQLDHARNVLHHPSPRSHPLSFLVLLLHGTASADNSAARLFRHVSTPRCRRTCCRRLGKKFR